MVTNSELTPQQAFQLYQDLTTVLESRHNRQTALATLQSDLQALQSVTTLTSADLQTITNDFNAIIQLLSQGGQSSASYRNRGR